MFVNQSGSCMSLLAGCLPSDVRRPCLDSDPESDVWFPQRSRQAVSRAPSGQRYLSPRKKDRQKYLCKLAQLQNLMPGTDKTGDKGGNVRMR